jgi:transcriptional regulator with XRE-family HTH domain
MNDDLIPLSKAIKQRRETLGVSQDTLAKDCGFDRTYISMLERGKRNPSYLNLVKLARGLKISVSQLTKGF